MKQQTMGRVVGVVVVMWVVLLGTPGGQVARARAVPAPSPHCGGWSIVPSPNPTDYQNELYAVAAVSTSDVWAVGDSQAIHGPGVALIEHWNGTSWQVVASPAVDGILLSIAAVSASNIWAVGADVTGPLIDHWDGSSWQVVASPSVVEGGFTGISAQSASDIWAVGAQAKGGPLAEHWDGSAWHLVPAPGVPYNANQFNSVSVLSASDVWAVGSHVGHGGHAESYSLIEHWDGTAWHISPSPNVGRLSSLNGVAAISTQDVWAVGDLGDSTLNEHWDGQQWHVVSPALNGFTYSVVALNSNDVWAVGFSAKSNFDTFAEQWNGTKWQHVPSPNVTATTISTINENFLNAVSASSPHNLWAVGYVRAYVGDATSTLIETYC